jgi:hypothetical protein
MDMRRYLLVLDMDLLALEPGHDLSAAAEHRMNLAVRHLRTIGCQASGLISDEDLLQAVRSETRAHAYEEVILATGRERVSWLARVLHLDPVRRLRRHWVRRLTVFPLSPDKGRPSPTWP